MCNQEENGEQRRRLCTVAEVKEAVDALCIHPYLIQASNCPGDISGLYSWWVDKKGARDLTIGLGFPIRKGLIYAGQAGATRWPSGKISKATLKSRILGFHLNGNIRGSTFRWTLAAALYKSLTLVTIGSMKLTKTSEDRLSDWIRCHLRVAVCGFGERDALDDLEGRVLELLNPPLNIYKMPTSPIRTKLRQLRKVIMVGPDQI